MTVLIAVSTAYPVNEGELSNERLSKSSSFRNADDRVRSLCAGWALDAALRTVGLRERDVTVVYDDHGKPVLQDHPHLHFSLSHSGEWAVCALSDTPVGVDVERIRPIDAARLVNRWLPAEQAITPLAFSSAVSWEILNAEPRTLNEPVICKFSGLR